MLQNAIIRDVEEILCLTAAGPGRIWRGRFSEFEKGSSAMKVLMINGSPKVSDKPTRA